MAKSSIPTIKLSDDECNILFKSITEKLNIVNPKFFYPIYKKIIDDDTILPEELRCTVLDSKFKCKEILSKIVDSDNEYDDENEDDVVEDKVDNDDSLNTEEEQSNKEEFKHLQTGGEFSSENNENQIKSINSDDNAEFDDADIAGDDDDDADDDGDDDGDDGNSENDAEINEAINNTFMARAIIERTNKSTGEKTYKEEKIHIKKTALLESLKVMNDEYVIPSKIQNKEIVDETLKNTMNKLNSYNNSGHVESLFLYLGNKLVESGKCPSFPYYYGCINGEDPNYHHNITDEYDSVSRTKWFRDRIKTDFDLLIIENDDIEDYENRVLSNVNKTINKCNENLKGGGNINNNAKDTDTDSSDSDSENENNSENNSENSSSSSDDDDEKVDDDDEVDNNKKEDKSNINLKDLDLDLDLNLDIDLNKSAIQSTDFIINMDNEDLNIDDFYNCDDCGDCDKCEAYLKENCSDKSNCKDIVKCNSVENSDDENDDDNSFIEELSDIDKDNLSLSEFDNNGNNMYFIKCESMPVSLSLMEKLDKTLDDILDEEYNMKENEWFAVFFQVAFGLAVAQKYFSFVHNDLHSSNVMFKATPAKFLYFQVNANYYRIPTYGKITKIIDFARGTFKFGDRWVFSDQFKEDNDAFGQYDYPVDGTLKNCEHKPNPSFDLVRLGTTVIQRLEDLSNVREFIEQITLDDNGNSLCYDEDTFQLYIDIAHHCHNAIPLNVMERPEFERFKINKNKLPKGQYVFKY